MCYAIVKCILGEMSLNKTFFKYVSRNISGMIAISVYILADTLFISMAAGTDGITVLNLALPLYGLLFALGSMIGIGSSIRYAIKKSCGEKEIDHYFSNAIIWQIICSIPFIILGIVKPQLWLIIMGGDTSIVNLGIDYVRIVLIAAPFFMINYTFTSFARNDDAPTIAMIASIGASMFNIVFDYIFMFPMKMGIAGAALATAISPAISSLICCSHYFSKKSNIKFRPAIPSPGLFVSCCKLGISAFVGEISSAITTTVFNILILRIAGNVGVAAYGIVANFSLVAMAIFNGLSQGMQPLLSDCYGKGQHKEVNHILKLGIITGFIFEIIIISFAWIFTDSFISIFNSEANLILAQYAHNALRFYFLGYIFAGINLVMVTYFSATDQPLNASVASITRGVIAIVICAIVMAILWGLNGIWCSFMASEFITLLIVFKLHLNKTGE